MNASKTSCQVAVIGAGVVGGAIARDLLKAGYNTMLIEANTDVGAGTSKAHTSILHTGFDATPESLESRLLRRGYQRMLEYAPQVGISIQRTGALLVAWSEDQLERLPDIQENATKNKVIDLRVLSQSEVRQLEPHLGEGVLGGLMVPGEYVICPYTPALAYATEFKINGGMLRLASPVTAIDERKNGYVLHAGTSEIFCRWVVNAAGLYSDVIDRMLGFNRFTVTPRRGELIVYDKFASRLISHPILPIPTARTKGVLISPTIFGNVLLGPTAEDLDDKTNTDNSQDGIKGLLEKGSKMLPGLDDEEITALYAGLRAATEHKDYQLFVEPERRYCCVGGIRSTGVSASLGIAEYVTNQISLHEPATARASGDWEIPSMPPIGENGMRPHRDSTAIERNPDYGRVVCHCEKTSRGEILDALNSPIPAVGLDGLRRRTRCLQGRCQGFHCLAEVRSLLSANLTQ